MHLALMTARVLAGAASIALALIASVLHETEEGLIQNRLEEAWVRADDLKKKVLSRELSLLRNSASVALSMMDRVLGEHTFSPARLRSVILLSFASSCFYYSMDNFYDGAGNLVATGFEVKMLGTLCIAIAFLPVIVRREWSNRLAMVASIASVIFLIVNRAHLALSAASVPDTVLAITASITVDLLFVILLRKIIKTAGDASNVWTVVVCLIMCLCAVLFIYGCLMLAWEAVFIDDVSSTKDVILSHPGGLLLFATSNLFDLYCVEMLLCVFVLCAVNHLLWPLVQRPIYAAQRFNLISKKKEMLTAAGACLLFAIYGSEKLPKELVELARKVISVHP